MASKEQQLDEKHRLLAIREHLKVHAQPGSPEFRTQVAQACLAQVQPIINANASKKGEEIISVIANSLGVRFEEVRHAHDITTLEEKYLKGEKEIGFAQVEEAMQDPTVDAILIQKMNVAPGAQQQWVAVLNLQQSESRAYWSRPHELVHRLAEPPQKRLPLYRHTTDHDDTVEQLVDVTAAEIAFPASIFRRMVRSVANEPLTWQLVKRLRDAFAPTASYLSVAAACVRFWPTPAYLLVASVRGRKNNPREAIALRAKVNTLNAGSMKAQIQFFENIRVPNASPMFNAHHGRGEYTDFGSLAAWSTSTGSHLPDRHALTSGKNFGARTYGLITLRD